MKRVYHCLFHHPARSVSAVCSLRMMRRHPFASMSPRTIELGCGHVMSSRRALSLSTDLLTSPTGLMALLYGRTSCKTSRDDKHTAGKDAPTSRRRSARQKVNGAFRRRGSVRRERGPHWKETQSGRAGDEENTSANHARRFGIFRTEAVWLGGVILVLSAVWESLSSHQDIFVEKLWQLFAVTLEVRSSQQPEYAMIMDWMGRQPEGREAMNVTLRPVLNDGSSSSGVSLSEDARESLVPGYGRHLMRAPDGTLMWIHRYEDVHKAKRDVSTPGWQGVGEHDVLRITFFSRRREVVPVFLSTIRQSWETHVKRHVQIYSTNFASTWRLLAERSARPLYTLYLPPTIKNVVEEVRTFLSMKEVYGALGIPWRRGYLLEGPPGTGKTSFVMALASELHLPIHLLPLHTPEIDDESLVRLVSTLPPKCILLVEDVENAITAGAYAPQAAPVVTQRVSIGAFLNAMDGVASSEGRVLIVTSNDPSRLPHPQAMLRPGRIDKRIHFSPLQEKEMAEMKSRFEDALAALPIHGTSDDAQIEGGVVKPLLFNNALRHTPSSPAEYQVALLDYFYDKIRKCSSASEANKIE